MPASDHGIFNLSDSSKLRRPAIWDVVSDAGHPVWVCGSMNAFHKPTINGAILPDPWSVNIRPSPTGLDPYFDFVRSQVLEYTRTKGTYTFKSALRFLVYMLRNGLTLATVVAIDSRAHFAGALAESHYFGQIAVRPIRGEVPTITPNSGNLFLE